MNNFKKKLYYQFEMSKLSKREVIVYLKSKCMQVKKEVFMIQKVYAQYILTTFNIKNCTPTTIHADKKIKLKIDTKEEEVDFTLY